MAGRSPKLDGRKAQLGARGLVADGITRVEAEGVKVPADLDRHGREAWGRFLATLVPRGNLAVIDLGALHMACKAFQRWRHLEAEIDRLNKAGRAEDPARPFAGEVQVFASGAEQKSTLRQLAKEAEASYHRWAVEFGGTPAARIKTAGTAQGDLFDHADRQASGKDDAEPAPAYDPTNPMHPAPAWQQ